MYWDGQEWVESQPSAIPSSTRPAQHGTRESYEFAGNKHTGEGSPNCDEDDEDNIMDLMASIRMHMIVDKSYPRSESSTVRRMAKQYPLKTRSRPLKPHEVRTACGVCGCVSCPLILVLETTPAGQRLISLATAT